MNALFKMLFEKKNILFVMPPAWDTYSPPLGIASLSAYLKSRGCRARVLDLNVDLFHKMSSENKIWWSMDMLNHWTDKTLFHRLLILFKPYLDEYVERILSLSAETIGFSIYDSNRFFALEMAKRIKEKDKKRMIIFGGPGCCNDEKRSWMPAEIVDMIIVGEGEEALCDVLLRSRGGRVATLPRIYSRASVLNIASLPFPTFDEFDLGLYREKNTLPLLMSRGCISHCAFCNDYYLSRPYRYRNPENIVSEIKGHVWQKNVTNFGFKDLAINGNTQILSSFCHRVVKEKLTVTWTAQAIPYAKTTTDLLKAMQKAGCTVLIYGLESASNAILKRMNKFFTKEIAQEVIRNTHRAGIRVRINIIVGFPGETEEDIVETASFLENNRQYIDMVASLNTCCVNNDTALEIHRDDYGILLPEDPATQALYWSHKDGTDYSIRRRRAERLLSSLKDLNIPVNQTNLYDTAGVVAT